MPRAKKSEELDFSEFPAGSITAYVRHTCLACIFDVFTGQLKMAPRTAYTEIRRQTPTVEDLTAPTPARPYFVPPEKNAHCPYCDSSTRWHARFEAWRMEGGSAVDKPRRALVKELKEDDFSVLEQKSDHREMFFHWLDSLGRSYDFTSDAWLPDSARLYLERAEPKTDWTGVFQKTSAVRRSRRLEEGWEIDQNRLYLAPRLYDEVLLVQYLVSRSHLPGGRTFEGRLVLQDLLGRLRRDHYLKDHGVLAQDPDALEKLLEQLSGGDKAATVYYLVDRRDFLAKAKAAYAKYSK